MNRLTLDSRLTPEHLADIKRGGGVHQRAQETVDKFKMRVSGSEEERLADRTAYRPVVLHANPTLISHRWPYAVMRIKRILEGVARSSSLEAAIGQAEYKTLAKEYVELYAFYLTRTRPPPRKGSDHNPFRNLSDLDASRMFVRKVEDLCDRSTRHAGLGSWYTK